MTRRDLVKGATATLAVGATLSSSPVGFAEKTDPGSTAPYDILRSPDNVTVFSGLDKPLELRRSSAEWRAGDTVIDLREHGAQVDLSLSAPSLRPTHVRLRWRGHLAT